MRQIGWKNKIFLIDTPARPRRKQQHRRAAVANSAAAVENFFIEEIESSSGEIEFFSLILAFRPLAL
jgi:hypothetical protein